MNQYVLANRARFLRKYFLLLTVFIAAVLLASIFDKQLVKFISIFGWLTIIAFPVGLGLIWIPVKSIISIIKGYRWMAFSVNTGSHLVNDSIFYIDLQLVEYIYYGYRQRKHYRADLYLQLPAGETIVKMIPKDPLYPIDEMHDLYLQKVIGHDPDLEALLALKDNVTKSGHYINITKFGSNHAVSSFTRQKFNTPFLERNKHSIIDAIELCLFVLIIFLLVAFNLYI